MNKNSLAKIAAPFFIVLIIHIIASFANWYEIFWWFDIPMHLIGGVATAISGYYLLQDYKGRNQFSIGSISLNILIIIGFVSLAAVCWEFLEFTLDILFNADLQPSLTDTMKDLANGIIGGGLTSLAILLRKNK